MTTPLAHVPEQHSWAGYCGSCSYEMHAPFAYKIGRKRYCASCALAECGAALGILLDPYWSPTVPTVERARQAREALRDLLQHADTVLEVLKPETLPESADE